MTAIRELFAPSNGTSIVSNIPAIKISFDLSGGSSAGAGVVANVPAMKSIKGLGGYSA